MPNYKQDPNDPKKQVPGELTDQHYDNSTVPVRNIITKTPNYILVTAATDGPTGFFFGSSASFAKKATIEDVTNSNALTGSQHYNNFGTLPAGTRLNIHPLAWSGSVGDAGKIIFMYKGGLDGGGI